jgi:helix-turn-helix protein
MANFGDTLKRERELREITLREISDATKINIRYLEALEQNRFESLPGGLFNKGFIRAYSTYIGVDGEAMVNCYLQEIAGRNVTGAPFAGDAPPGLLRPSESPRRRAGPQVGQGSNGRPLKVTFGSPQAEAAAEHPVAIAPAPALQLPATAVDRPAAHRADESHPDPPARAVTHIEDAATADPSRVLPAILTLTGVAAVCFVVLALIFGRSGSSGRSMPAAAGIETPVSPVTIGAEAQKGGSAAGAAHDVPSDLASATAAIAGAAPAGSAPAGPPPGARPAPTTRPAAPVRPAGTGAPVVPPAVGREGGPVPPRAQARAAESGPMEVQVETTGTTWVQLFCDDREEINWVMKEGESDAMRCLRLVRVSAADAAAVRLRVNGARCVPLGDSGSRVHGFTIRSDDFREICPAAPARGDDGRH